VKEEQETDWTWCQRKAFEIHEPFFLIFNINSSQCLDVRKEKRKELIGISQGASLAKCWDKLDGIKPTNQHVSGFGLEWCSGPFFLGGGEKL